jgi:hypothetical protein
MLEFKIEQIDIENEYAFVSKQFSQFFKTASVRLTKSNEPRLTYDHLIILV